MWTLTRYEDIRAALLDPERFTNRIGNSAGATQAWRPTRRIPRRPANCWKRPRSRQEIQKLYEDTGWPACPTLEWSRRARAHAATPGLRLRVSPHARSEKWIHLVEELTNRLFDHVYEDVGHCEWVRALAIPLPLYVIGRQMGVPDDDMDQIKAWTDSWVAPGWV